MPFIVRLYLNTAFASIVLCAMLALWSAYNAVRNRSPTPTYSRALIFNQLSLLMLGLWYIGLRLVGQVGHRTLLPLIYYLVALAVLPCVRLYVWDKSSRGKSFSIALACIFISGMVVRALQTGIVPH